MSNKDNPSNTPMDEPQDQQDNTPAEATEQQEGPKFNFINKNVTMTRSPFKEGVLKKQKDAEPLVSFGMSLENLDVVQTPNVKLLRDSDEKWQAAYGQSYVDQISNVFLDIAPTIQTERAMASGHWVQHLEYQGYKMQADAPRIEPSTNGEKLVGTAAVSQMNMLLGGGKYIRVPLWASGFWITLTVPSNSSLLNLNLILEEFKYKIKKIMN